MTNFMKKELDALNAFRDEMAEYGLPVSSGTGGTYEDDVYKLTVKTKYQPAKGQKKLIERLEKAGYCVAKWMEYDNWRRNGRKHMVFTVWKTVEIKLEGNDTEAYVEQDKEPATITVDDNVPGMVIEPPALPEVVIPEDFDV